MKDSPILYICYPFRSDPVRNAKKIRKVCRKLVCSGKVPLAPQLFLSQFLDERSERDLAMRLCCRLVEVVDEVRVYGTPTAGMRLEIAKAHHMGIPVVKGKIE